MIRGGILNSRTRRVRRAAAAAPVMAAAVAVAALGVTVVAAAAPALAAQRPGGPAASHVPGGATGQHTAGRMSPGASWAHIAASGDHTCGIRTDATLWCWGDNSAGELGLGNYTGQDRPRQVTTPAAGGWASVTAGTFYTCATRTDGTLWCWGNNWGGELGIGNKLSQGRPRQVTAPERGGWASVTSGGDHTCATRADATLWCWGVNNNGQLGLGNHADHDRPRQVTSPATGGWASVTANGQDTCAGRIGGTLWCWGYGYYGQLGIGNHKGQCHPQQVTAPAAGGWTLSTAAGLYFSCAIRTGGTLWCWGSNYSGNLGIGGDTDQELPRQVSTPAAGGWGRATAGYGHTCATRTDGTLWCWGYNDNGELGIGNYTDQDQPRQVTG